MATNFLTGRVDSIRTVAGLLTISGCHGAVTLIKLAWDVDASRDLVT